VLPSRRGKSRRKLRVLSIWLTIRIDELYLDNSTVDKAFRLETYRSTGAISSTVSQQLRCYFVARCAFPQSGPIKNAEGVTDIRSVSDAAFLEKASDHTINIYQEVMNEVERRSGPVIEMYEVEESRERRIVIGYKWVIKSVEAYRTG
jgi:glutamate dehydrogenase